MGERGLEPLGLAAQDPKSCVSANSTTRPAATGAFSEGSWQNTTTKSSFRILTSDFWLLTAVFLLFFLLCRPVLSCPLAFKLADASLVAQ